MLSVLAHELMAVTKYTNLYTAVPLPPNVSLELTSWNTMQLSWNTPFTTEGYPVVKYSVYTTNTNTQQRTRIDIYPSSDSETHTIQDTPSDCHTLLFEVFAENSVGTSTAGKVSGGFPVGRYCSSHNYYYHSHTHAKLHI